MVERSESDGDESEKESEEKRASPEAVPAEITLSQIKPHLEKYSDYLSEKTSRKFRTFKHFISEDKGRTLRLKWVTGKGREFDIMPPTFVMKIKYDYGMDTYDIETSFWDKDMNQFFKREFTNIYWEDLSEPSTFFGWVDDLSKVHLKAPTEEEVLKNPVFVLGLSLMFGIPAIIIIKLLHGGGLK